LLIYQILNLKQFWSAIAQLPETWGPKNFIAIAVMKNNKWKIAKLKYIDYASIKCEKQGVCEFAYFKFVSKPATPNQFPPAFLEYA
jgi:hypothetical protein